MPKPGAYFLEVEYKRGEMVYLKTDIEQQPYIVVGYRIDSAVKYVLACGGMHSEHEAFEITQNMDETMMERYGGFGLLDEDDEEP